MDLTLITEEAKAAERRAGKKEARAIKVGGEGCSAQATAIAQAYIGRLADAVPTGIARIRGRGNAVSALIPILAGLDARKIALVALQGTLQTIARNERKQWGSCVRRLGTMLEREAYAADLTSYDKRLAVTLEQKARRRYGNVGRRVKMTQHQAEIAGFKYAKWTPVRIVRAGAWLLDLLLSTLPEAFGVEGDAWDKAVILMPDAVELATAAIDALTRENYQLLPITEPPLPWTSFVDGGAPHHPDTVMRTPHADVKAQVAAAIRSGQMQPALDGLNALQGVAWTLNTRMYEVIKACFEGKVRTAEGAPIKGMPRDRKDWPDPGKPWIELTPDEVAAYSIARGEINKHNQRVTGDTLTLRADLATADLLAAHPRWWTPMNLDFRGRVYALTQFNFARDDRVRSMFLFADGEPLGEEGLWWLKVHVANTAAFDRIDKAPLSERVSWVDANLNHIRAMTADPMVETWWHQADKPFLFLAAAFELISALQSGPSNYICRLPTSWDGTCSGLQHLCAMTRAEEGHLVNLSPTLQRPSDVYATVAHRVSTRLTADAARTWPENEAWRGSVSAAALAYGWDRKAVKRNVMTFSYSSKPHGMAGQLQEDLMAKLAAEVVAGQRSEHPFGVYARGSTTLPGKAARHLAQHSYDAICEVIHRPAEAMAFLQRIARTLAHERKCMRWTTPVGIPWINRYHEPTTERVELWMYDKGVRVRVRTEVATGDDVEINKEKSANACSPNFVHACDGGHLLLVARRHAAERLGPIATVHDSFGCLPSRATAFHRIIREELVGMYERHDVLAEVLAQAKRDLTSANHHKLPNVPEYGTLDLKGILDATFAFS